MVYSVLECKAFGILSLLVAVFFFSVSANGFVFMVFYIFSRSSVHVIFFLWLFHRSIEETERVEKKKST